MIDGGSRGCEPVGGSPDEDLIHEVAIAKNGLERRRRCATVETITICKVEEKQMKSTSKIQN